MLVRVARVADLIHDAGALPDVTEHRFVERHRIAYRIHREHDLLAFDAKRLGYRLDVRLPPVFGDELLLDLQDPIRRIAHRARHTDRAVVAQEAAQLARDHRHAVG